MSLSLAGDLIVATESARFTMAYTQIGASPDGSSTFFLPRLVGVKRALELTFLNRVLSAREAMEWGIVNQVFPDDQFQAGVRGLQPGQDAQECRLPRSTLANERNSASGWNVDAHIVQRYDGSEAVGHISGSEGRRHALKTDYTRDLALCLPRASTITR